MQGNRRIHLFRYVSKMLERQQPILDKFGKFVGFRLLMKKCVCRFHQFFPSAKPYLLELYHFTQA